MDNLENSPLAQPDSNDLQEQCESLRHLFVLLLVLVIIISGTLNIYLLRQWRTTQGDLELIRPQVVQVVSEYQKVHAPIINDFLAKLVDFSKTHPDFAPILAKYGIKPTGATGAPPAAVTSPVKK